MHVTLDLHSFCARCELSYACRCNICTLRPRSQKTHLNVATLRLESTVQPLIPHWRFRRNVATYMAVCICHVACKMHWVLIK